MLHVQPLILAAGKGTRMNHPELPKVLIPLKGKPVVNYILDSLSECDFAPAAVVVGYRSERVQEALGDDYTYVLQDEQLGTGHAVKMAERQLAGQADLVLVINGDQPLISAESMQQLVATHHAAGAVASFLTVTSTEPTFSNFGRILRDEKGRLLAIRENKDATPAEQAINEYNAGLYCFTDAWLWPALADLKRENTQGEYYLTDLIAMAIAAGEVVMTVQPEHWQEGLGINTPGQFHEVEAQLENPA